VNALQHRPGVLAADPWLTVEDAAARALCRAVTIRRALATGRLRGVRLAGGRRWRLRASWVDAWLESFEANETK
jgi:excisionase family DNA binding protein